MATRLMRWTWPTASSKKFAVRLVVRGIERLLVDKEPEAELRMRAEVRWKGKVKALSSLRSLKRNCTREEMVVGGKGELEWNEEFENVAVLTAPKESTYNPWEVEIAVLSGMRQGNKQKTSIYGLTSLNIAEYASAAGEELELNLPLLRSGVTAEPQPILHLSLKLLELTSCTQQPETFQRPATSPSSLEDKAEVSTSKSGFKKIFQKIVPSRKSRKTVRENEGSDGRYSARSDDHCYTFALDTDSVEEDDPDDALDYHNGAATVRNSFNYGTLADANFLGIAVLNAGQRNEDHEDWIYYSNKRSDFSSSHVEMASQSAPEKSPKRSLLPWKKRKYNFRSPKAKGEPLLKKCYGEDGGDDIDYDRRLLSSPDDSLSGKNALGFVQHSSTSEFGDDIFAVGCWESKEIISRCGRMKLSTQIFFASIDQRSERAAGESACTALVAVIADWFQSNPDIMPIKSQLDGLIREGSLEWRNLCDNQTYMERFPDKHFDLETIIQAKIRPLSIIPEKSFIGFFHPECCEEDRNGFEFLDGAMSFDDIWGEISCARSDCLFIVSWNDHFFVLKVEADSYYIIDTLGERLFEGCDQAYILKFDKITAIHKLPAQEESSTNAKESSTELKHECPPPAEEQPPELICEGKESCKEYIKSFLAAIPIRELQADIKKGLTASSPLYQRLQVEFHYTEALGEPYGCPPQYTGPSALTRWPADQSPEAGKALECT